MITSTFRNPRMAHSLTIVSGERFKEGAAHTRIVEGGTSTHSMILAPEEECYYLTGLAAERDFLEGGVAGYGPQLAFGQGSLSLQVVGIIPEPVPQSKQFYSDLCLGWIKIPSLSGNFSTTQVKVLGPLTEEITESRNDVRKLIDLLGRMADGALATNFDSEQPLSLKSLESARRFFESLPEGFPLPKVGPAGEGAISLRWTISRKTTIMILDGDLFHLVKNAGSSNAEYLDSQTLSDIPPKELIAELF